ncbi:MAG: serine/threonine protein kinase [Acidimicrobiales bacterium]|jgi:serine/threonine protein kinase
MTTGSDASAQGGPVVDLGIEGISGAQHIGSGGAADVYRAEQPRLGRTVAVKVLRANTSTENRARFEREAQTLGRLSNHPGIVTLHEAGLTGIGQPFLMMEYCPAGTLADRTTREGAIGWQETCQVVADIAEVVDEAHAAGVLHRDLKPANVLIDGRGKHLVADFGVAALSDTGNFSAAADFTPGYAPPEALRGEAATPAGDVYIPWRHRPCADHRPGAV